MGDTSKIKEMKETVKLIKKFNSNPDVDNKEQDFAFNSIRNFITRENLE